MFRRTAFPHDINGGPNGLSARSDALIGHALPEAYAEGAAGGVVQAVPHSLRGQHGGGHDNNDDPRCAAARQRVTSQSHVSAEKEKSAHAFKHNAT
jgi:hypothetical protein